MQPPLLSAIEHSSIYVHRRQVEPLFYKYVSLFNQQAYGLNMPIIEPEDLLCRSRHITVAS